jgi:hypothetical protein
MPSKPPATCVLTLTLFFLGIFAPTSHWTTSNCEPVSHQWTISAVLWLLGSRMGLQVPRANEVEGWGYTAREPWTFPDWLLLFSYSLWEPRFVIRQTSTEIASLLNDVFLWSLRAGHFQQSLYPLLRSSSEFVGSIGNFTLLSLSISIFCLNWRKCEYSSLVQNRTRFLYHRSQGVLYLRQQRHTILQTLDSKTLNKR